MAFGWGLGCHVYHRRVDVPRSLGGGGYALDRDVRGVHFMVKWKDGHGGLGGMELIPLLTQLNRFWSLGGGGSIWGEGMGVQCPRKDSGRLTPFRYVIFQILNPINNF